LDIYHQNLEKNSILWPKTQSNPFSNEDIIIDTIILEYWNMEFWLNKTIIKKILKKDICKATICQVKWHQGHCTLTYSVSWTPIRVHFTFGSISSQNRIHPYLGFEYLVGKNTLTWDCCQVKPCECFWR